MSARIISAFPACGKTTYYKEWSKYSPENVWRTRNNGEDAYDESGNPMGFKILDSDSSEFSWVKDENGSNTSIRNPEFPQNYIDHIKEKMQSEFIIFVSSHDVVREALKQNNIPYDIFYPRKDQKEEWINRFRKRGNDEKFISFISDNWDKFIDDIEKDDYPTKHVLHNDLYGDHRYINSVTVNELFECLCYAKNEQEGSSTTKKIRGWDDLDGLENEHFKITVDRASCNGHIECKTDWAKHKYPWGYLSTHTFYPDSYKFSEEMLRERGFDVEFICDESDEFIPIKEGCEQNEG